MIERPAIENLQEITAVWRWPSFQPNEFRCHGTGKYKIVPYFMDCLQALRGACDFPFVVNSGYRAPEYNAQVADTGFDGPHTTGQAVDLRTSGAAAFRILAMAPQYGFTGIGVSQRGPHEHRFIHLDTLVTGQRPWVWSY